MQALRSITACDCDCCTMALACWLAASHCCNCACCCCAVAPTAANCCFSCWLARCQPVRFAPQLGDGLGQILVLPAHPVALRALRRGGGSLELLQVRTRLGRVVLRRVARDNRGVPLLVGLEKHDLADHQQRETQPEKPAFQIHGWLLFALSWPAVKHEMNLIQPRTRR